MSWYLTRKAWISAPTAVYACFHYFMELKAMTIIRRHSIADNAHVGVSVRKRDTQEEEVKSLKSEGDRIVYVDRKN
ncbi:unnamed protein product [Cylicocyclus nassatus]|uniref:Kinesin motor domain-containing protein n=1 Tax=Cylicocyclus nassatus TaxID=53992 RepID=A0AA36GNZ5_CYLNA|nr:unnamed protein product [Cylicocyclus nassatus]